MSTNSLTCAATPAALAHHVDYAQRIIEDAHAVGVAVSFDRPDDEARSNATLAHWRELDADYGRTYVIWAFVASPVDGEGQLRLRVEVRDGAHTYGSVTLTTDPDTDSALASALDAIVEISEKQNSTD